MTSSQQRTGIGQQLDQFVAAGAAAQRSANSEAFVQDACRHSGLPPKSIKPHEAQYRLIDSEGGLQTGLSFSSGLEVDGEPLRLGDYIAAQLRHDTEALARAVWAIESFGELRTFLHSLRGLVRYQLEADGRLRGDVIPCLLIERLIERIEQGESLNSNGDLLSDAVTRALGLRRKVLLLDYGRRRQQSDHDSGKPLGPTQGRFVILEDGRQGPGNKN
ncbi:MAG: hypothetical protein EPO48_05845 [Nevskiaceae bacterium]|nr:MAG: hypothetical protein EPO48_05845 [Nevskiaceae bacterium]